MEKCNLEEDEFIILAGKNYYDMLIPYLNNYSLPLKNRPLGMRISYLNQILHNKFVSYKTISDNTQIEENDIMCDKLHILFGSLPRYNYSNIVHIPFDNGIYIVFEKGEKYKKLG